MLTRPRTFQAERREEHQPNFAERLERSRARQREVAERLVRKQPTAQHDQRGYWQDPGQTLGDLRVFGEFLRLDKIGLKTACIISGIVQATTLALLATTSWMLPWLIPSASIGFVVVVGLIYYLASDLSETSIIAYVVSCFVLFVVAACDVVSVQYCLHLPECSTLAQTAIPVCIMIFEPLLAMSGMYLAVFKTKYVPQRKHKRDDTMTMLREWGKLTISLLRRECGTYAARLCDVLGKCVWSTLRVLLYHLPNLVALLHRKVSDLTSAKRETQRGSRPKPQPPLASPRVPQPAVMTYSSEDEVRAEQETSNNL